MQNSLVQFLSVDEVLAIHERLIARFGGRPGVRDQGLLESALFRPQTGCYDDLPSMAAALYESLLLNHAFVDGNERVAFFATDVFLRLNGWKIAVDGNEAHRFLMTNLEAGIYDYRNLQTWIRENLAAIRRVQLSDSLISGTQKPLKMPFNRIDTVRKGTYKMREIHIGTSLAV